jgi:hypothetical protein
MDAGESGFILMELKYCERCGGLWLRPRGSGLIYCPSCARALAGDQRGTLFPCRGSITGNAPDDMDQAFWSEGGNA